MSRAEWMPRRAVDADVPALEALIALSVRRLHSNHYSGAQIDASIGTVFGVDRQLVEDGTYFVVEEGGVRVGCGGWSRRASLCGSDSLRTGRDPEVDPRTEPARVRAFFVHPDWVRRGIGGSIMELCEREILGAGFSRVLIMATLPGAPLYASFGYRETGRVQVAMPGGLSIETIRMEKALSRTPGPGG